MTIKLPRRRRCPTVLQMEAVECGAAALAMILEYYGRKVPLEELREVCGVSRDGTNAANLVEAAKKYGLDGEGFRAEPEELGDYEFPLLLHWNFNHFVVLEGMRWGKIYINDPMHGPRTVSVDEIDHAFTGVLLQFKPGPQFKKGGRTRSVMRSLSRRFRDTKALAFVLWVGLLLVVPGLGRALFAKIFVDEILIHKRYEWFPWLTIAMVTTIVLLMVLTWFQGIALLRFRTKIILMETTGFLAHMLRLPMSFFGQRMVGDLVRRIRNNERVADLLTGDLATALLNMVTVVFFGAVMAALSPPLFGITLFFVAVNLLVLKYNARFRKDESLRYMTESARLHGLGTGGLHQIETLKATGTETHFNYRWTGYQALAVNSLQRLGRFNARVGGIPQFLRQVNTLTLLGFGAVLVVQGNLTIGTLVAILALGKSFLTPFDNLIKLASHYQEARGLMDQLDDTCDFPREPRQGSDEPASKLSGRVSVENLAFGYRHEKDAVVRDICFELEPGFRAALVGPSGCGKSTIVRILAGLHQPWQGTIRWDGKLRENLPKGSFYGSVAMVDQNITLFEGSIRDNLSLWDDDLPLKTIIEAARDAEIHHIINQRPGGYNSQVSEGGLNFSVGQRQRLELARALSLKPTLLILDEATSALDTQTEAKIFRQLRQRGCTCLMVAHRLSTIRDCDEIFVLEQGSIVQHGTHRDLITRDGLYRELVEMSGLEDSVGVE